MFWLVLALVVLVLGGVLSASPTITLRTLPNAIRLDDGYQSLIVFTSNSGLAIFEKTVQPGALEGGDPIMTSTMLNVDYETKAPQRLKGIDDIVVVAAYDPAAVSDINDLVNLPDSISVHWPEGSIQAQWGYLRRAEFSPLTKGEQPEVTLTIVVTNWDPVNCVEAGPIWVEGTGSCGPYAE